MGGDNFSILWGGHRAHGGIPQSPPLGKTLGSYGTAVYLSVYFLPQSDLFAYNTRSENFSGLTLQNNTLKQTFDPALQKNQSKMLSISPQL